MRTQWIALVLVVACVVAIIAHMISHSVNTTLGSNSTIVQAMR